MTESAVAAIHKDLFARGGEMGALMSILDWSKTPIDSVEKWPQSLRTSVSICLTSRFPILIWWGAELVMLYNDAYRPILGATKHPKAMGQCGRDCWPEIWDLIGPMLEGVLTKGEATWSDDQLLLLDRNGYLEECYFTFSYSPILDETGNVGGVFTAVTETTVRVLGERRLRTLRELGSKTANAKTAQEACEISAQTLTENPADIPFALLYSIDEAGKQAQLKGATGINPGTAASPQVVDLLASENEPGTWPLATVVHTKEPQQVDDLPTRFALLTQLTASGFPQSALVLPLAQASQDLPAGLLVVGINPKRALDEEYWGFFQLIAGHIATAITNACAYEAERKRAEALAELDQAKTDFFSNVSHEFRTPLTLMLGPLSDALTDTEDPLSPKQRERIEVLQRNGMRLLKLVNTLLDFSRLEAGRIQAVYEPTNLASLTTDLASAFRSAVERVGLRLVVDCPPLAESVFVDRQMWEKIVFNLLSNAFKFTFEGEIEISLHGVRDRVELVVRDTGVGIPVEELPHLFERFHRVYNNRARTHEGSGIGLALVQELVRLHGGTVQVSSVVGQGSTFTVTLPTGYAHLPADRIGAAQTWASTALGVAPYIEEVLRWVPADAEEQAENRGGDYFPSSPTQEPSARILLADDNADMRDYIKRLLQSRYEVETVVDGAAALATARQRVPDLVLTDVMMPGLDGFELLRELRADPNTREIPIVLLSARAGEESRIEGLEAGADDYLIKPFSARELLARVESNLKMAQMRQEATRREQKLRAQSVADRRAAEDAYNRISQILESMTDAFIAVDRDWRITYQNAEGERINGKPRRETIGKTPWEEWPAVLGTNIEYQYRRAMAEQVPVHFEHHYYSPPTYDVWLEIHAYPSENGLGIFYRDITYRVQAEKERANLLRDLQEVNTLLDTLFNNAPLGIGIWDEKLRFVRLNHALAEINGIPQQAHIGKTVAELLPQLDASVIQAFNHAIDTGEIVAREASGETPAVPGKLRYWAVNYYPIKLPGEITWVGAICEEITDRKQAESEREQLLERERVARTAAETANRIKDEFLAVLSHELRTPLNPILGWSKLLQSRKFDEATTAKALETIERNATLQTQLIEDLLDVSRILQGKLSLNVCPVNLVSTIEAALETLRLAALSKSIKINTVLNPNVREVAGDAARLQQIIWNLLSNAVKFTPSGGRIEVYLESIDFYAQIRVSDTGKGIDPEFLPYVFDYFRQENSKTTRKFGGLGLGLAIVRHLVELHGGTVTASSPGIDRGATFIVSLPLMNIPTQTIEDNNQSTQSPELNGVRVLVVDDDVDSLELLTFILEQNGASVTGVASASAALEAFPVFQPDLLVSDIGMPEMDGYMLIRTIRAMPSEQGGQIAAIALTAYAGEIDHQQALEAGFQMHLAKPIEPNEVVAAIASLVKISEYRK